MKKLRLREPKWFATGQGRNPALSKTRALTLVLLCWQRCQELLTEMVERESPQYTAC
jgi:hypothetical protein